MNSSTNSSPQSAPRRPNIVLIVCDDIGYGDLGCYGSTLHRTPRLDRMAQEGVRFTDFYTASPFCTPARAALFTGRHPRRTGLAYGHDFWVLLPRDPIGLAPEETTIARWLREGGYVTKLIGKWHLGDQPPFLPTRHGFDEFFGLPYSNDMAPDHPQNDRFQFPPLPLMRDEKVIAVAPNQAALTDCFVEEAVSFMEAHRSEPFFLCLAHIYPHEPIYAPYNFLARSQNGPYGAAVEHLDHSTGILLDALQKLGLDDDTIVIFTSDHGSNGQNGGSNAPLRGTKGSTWEGGARVPCLMRWPRGIAPRATCRELATAMDLFPTLSRAAGLSLPDTVLDGRDIGPLLRGESGARSPHASFPFYVGNRFNAVRAGRWKLHLPEDQLFDLETDPGETRNEFAAQPEIVAELRNIAEEYRRDLGDERTAVEGIGARPPGRVENPVSLTSTNDSACRAWR